MLLRDKLGVVDKMCLAKRKYQFVALDMFSSSFPSFGIISYFLGVTIFRKVVGLVISNHFFCITKCEDATSRKNPLRSP
jgi:hypothetical protein